MILDILLRIFSKAHEIIFLSNSITCDEFHLFLFRCFDHISSELKDTPYSGTVLDNSKTSLWRL